MNNWGIYPWFRESGSDLIHPDDLAIVQAYSPYCVACEVVGHEGQYLVLRYGEHLVRCKPKLFRPIPIPAFRVGQLVKVKPPRTERMGVVRCIGWHYKTNEPSFYLAVEGKRLKSRYWAEELEAVATDGGADA